MKFIKTYEEFRFKDEEEDTEVLGPDTDNDEDEILIDKPVDDTLLGGPKSSYPRSREEVVNIKNWKVY